MPNVWNGTGSVLAANATYLYGRWGMGPALKQAGVWEAIVIATELSAHPKRRAGEVSIPALVCE